MYFTLLSVFHHLFITQTNTQTHSQTHTLIHNTSTRTRKHIHIYKKKSNKSLNQCFHPFEFVYTHLWKNVKLHSKVKRLQNYIKYNYFYIMFMIFEVSAARLKMYRSSVGNHCFWASQSLTNAWNRSNFNCGHADSVEDE